MADRRRKRSRADNGANGLDVLMTKDISPEALGVECMSLHRDEHDATKLAIGRNNGSVALYQVVMQRHIFNFVMVACTGGRENVSLTKVLFSEDGDVLFVSTLSGQILSYCGHSLRLLFITHRSGGRHLGHVAVRQFRFLRRS